MSASPGRWETQDKNTELGRVRARGAPGGPEAECRVGPQSRKGQRLPAPSILLPSRPLAPFCSLSCIAAGHLAPGEKAGCEGGEDGEGRALAEGEGPALSVR